MVVILFLPVQQLFLHRSIRVHSQFLPIEYFFLKSHQKTLSLGVLSLTDSNYNVIYIKHKVYEKETTQPT